MEEKMSDNKAILKVRNLESTEFALLPAPQTLQWEMTDREAEGCSGYNQIGEYFRDVIGRKVTLSATWGLLTETQMSLILTAIADDEFILEYPDAKTGNREVITAYVSSRTAPLYRYVQKEEGEEDTWMWQGLSVTFMQK